MTDTPPELRARRMLVASEFWPGATARGLLPGLRQAGWAVGELSERLYLPPGETLPSRIEARIRRRSRLRHYHRAILRDVERLSANVLLTVKGTLLTPDVLAALRHRGVALVNVYPDYHFNDVPIEWMADYDLVATTKSFQVEPLTRLMGAERVAFLHHGYSDDIHRPLAAGKLHDVDVLYVGNASQSKADLLIYVATALPEIAFRIVGERWRPFLAGTPAERGLVDGSIRGDYYAAEIAGAKIILAMHMGPDHATGFTDLVSTRTFEIPACGGFMLHTDNEEVRTLYDVPGEIDTFSSTDDCVAKIRHWLTHTEERQIVAARGHARAVPAYGYAARGLELSRHIEERVGRNMGSSPAIVP